MKTTEFFIKARKKLKLNQIQMASLLGTRSVNVCKYERGYTEPSAQNVLDVLKKLKVKIF